MLSKVASSLSAEERTGLRHLQRPRRGRIQQELQAVTDVVLIQVQIQGGGRLLGTEAEGRVEHVGAVLPVLFDRDVGLRILHVVALHQLRHSNGPLPLAVQVEAVVGVRRDIAVHVGVEARIREPAVEEDIEGASCVFGGLGRLCRALDVVSQVVRLDGELLERCCLCLWRYTELCRCRCCN